MASFEVEMNGRVFEIEAPDQATAISSLDGYMRQLGVSKGLGVQSGDEARAAAAGDTRAKMPLKDIEYAYDTAAARGDRPESKAMAGAYVQRERQDSPISTGVGDRVRSLARGVPFVGEYLDEANAKTDELLGGNYQKRLDYERARDQSFDVANPVQSLAGRAAGAIGGTVAAAPVAAATGTSALLGLGAKTLPGAIGRGMVAGAAQGVASGHGNSEDGYGLKDAGRDAALGGGIGAAVPAVLGAAGKMFAGPKPAAAPDLKSIKDASKASYKEARDADVMFHPRDIRGLVGDASDTLRAEGYRDYLAPKTYRALEELGELVKKPSKFDDIDGVRKLLTKAKADPSESDAARRVIEKIDDFLDVIPAAKEARGNYAAFKRGERVEEALKKAERQAGKGGSGGNVNNAIRQKISSILDNPRKVAGFSEAERAQMEKIVAGTPGGNTARLAGKLSPQGNGLMLALGLGGVMSNPVLGIPAIAGMGSKLVGDKMTRKEAEKLAQMVRARAPMFAEGREAIAQRALEEQRFNGLLGPLGALSARGGLLAIPR